MTSWNFPSIWFSKVNKADEVKRSSLVRLGICGQDVDAKVLNSACRQITQQRI